MLLLLFVWFFFHSSWPTPHSKYPPYTKVLVCEGRGGGRVEGDQTSHFLYPFNLVPTPFYFLPFLCTFLMENIVQCCVIFRISSVSVSHYLVDATSCPSIPASCTLSAFFLPGSNPTVSFQNVCEGYFLSIPPLFCSQLTCWQTLWFVGRLQQREDLQTSSNDSSQSDLYERLVCMHDLQCRKLSFKRHQLLLMSHYYPSVEEPF